MWKATRCAFIKKYIRFPDRTSLCVCGACIISEIVSEDYINTAENKIIIHMYIIIKSVNLSRFQTILDNLETFSQTAQNLVYLSGPSSLKKSPSILALLMAIRFIPGDCLFFSRIFTTPPHHTALTVKVRANLSYPISASLLPRKPPSKPTADTPLQVDLYILRYNMTRRS